MKKAIAILALTVVGSQAFALQGYISRAMNCAHLQSITQREGEITILHRIGSMTFYSSAEKCDTFPYRAEAVRGYEPAADTNRCFVGWECRFTGGN